MEIRLLVSLTSPHLTAPTIVFVWFRRKTDYTSHEATSLAYSSFFQLTQIQVNMTKRYMGMIRRRYERCLLVLLEEYLTPELIVCLSRPIQRPIFHITVVVERGYLCELALQWHTEAMCSYLLRNTKYLCTCAKPPTFSCRRRLTRPPAAWKSLTTRSISVQKVILWSYFYHNNTFNPAQSFVSPNQNLQRWVCARRSWRQTQKPE